MEASGIPKLRQYCLSLAADDRLCEARNAIRSEAPGLLTSAELWASSHMRHGAFDDVDKSNIHQHLDNIRSQVGEPPNTLYSQLSLTVSLQVPVYIAELRESFIDCFEEQIMRVWGMHLLLFSRPPANNWKNLNSRSGGMMQLKMRKNGRRFVNVYLKNYEQFADFA